MTNIVKIESEEYFKNVKIFWDERNEMGRGEIRVANRGVFQFSDNRYPKYFRYEESWDERSCGTWVEVSKQDYQQYIYKRIKDLTDEINTLTKELA